MKWLVFASVAFCAAAFADDGLVVHFTVSKFAVGKKSTYSDGILMRKTEAATLAFPSRYEIRIESQELSAGEVNLMVTLKDLSSGMPIYAGSGAAPIKIGESKQIQLDSITNAAARYEILVDTSYGQLPAPPR